MVAERCGSCGAELFAGQQYCRRCGAPAAAGRGEARTQMLPGAEAAPGTVALTPRATGDPALVARPTERQTLFGGPAHTAPLAATAPPPARPPRRALAVALLVVGLGGVLAAALFSRGLLGVRPGPAAADRPAVVGAAPDVAAGESFLEEAGAVEAGEQAVVTRAYDLSPDTSLTFKSPDGSLSVEGWDEERVEITVTKRGGTAEERRNARVTLRHGGGVFAVTAPGSAVKVSLAVRLPRGARRVELSSNTGSVQVSKLDAPLAVSVRDGSISLEDVSGPVQAKSVNGGISVVYKRAERAGEQELKTVNGGIEVRLAERMNADVKGSVVNGRIEVDDGAGLQVQKQRVGWSLDGRVGEGGPLLSLKTVNGSISVSK